MNNRLKARPFKASLTNVRMRRFNNSRYEMVRKEIYARIMLVGVVFVTSFLFTCIILMVE